MARPVTRKRELHLYVLTQFERTGHDIYDSIVVAAYSRSLAQKMHPEMDKPWMKGQNPWKEPTSNWASTPQNVHTNNIGLASPKITTPRIIHKSYKAG